MQDPIFEAKELLPNTWLISGHGSSAYLCAGEDEGVLVDSGDAYGNIRAFAEKLCGKPVKTVLNTHGHFDHTGGNGYFETAYMGRLAAVIAKTPNGSQPLDRYPLDYEIVTVDDGFTITVGGRTFEAFRMDGHSPDSTAWLDKQARILFTGDNLAAMTPLQYQCVDPQPSMLLYAMSIAKLMARRDEYDYVCFGHGRELGSGDMVNHGLMAALRALEGEIDERPPRPAGGMKRPPNDPNKGPEDHGPDFSKHNPADAGFIRYKDVAIMFNKRYLKDPTRYDIV